MKVAIIGSGISGLSVAHQLRSQAQVTLFESGSYFGGHTHTVDVTLPNAAGKAVTHGVDTGFLVFNERTYPHLIALLAELGVATAKSDMSFSVQVPGARGGKALEWSGTNLSTVFAQRSNLVNPRFWGMLTDLLRFNQLCTRIAQANAEQALMQPLGDFLQRTPLWRRLPRLVLPAHAGLHLELPDGPDAEVPGGNDDPLLPQPRPDPGGQPAPVVDGDRRRPQLCGKDPGRRARQAPEHPRAPHRARRRRRARVHRPGHRAFRPCGAGHAFRPIPGAAGAAHGAGTCGAGRHPLPAQPRRAAHRHHRAAAAPRCLGRLEL